MNKKLLFALIISALIPFKIYADWVSLDRNRKANTPPEVKLISDNESSTLIKINIAGFYLNDLVTNGKTYQSIDLLSEMITTNPGLPEMSYIAKVLAIPDYSGVSVEVVEMGEVQTIQNVYLPPARESWIEGQPESPYVENADFYSSDEIFPKQIADVEKPSIFRDFRIARVSVYPIRYNPGKKELQAVSSITIRVNYDSGEVINPKTSPKKKIAPSFGKIYRSSIFNYQNVLNKSYGGKEEGREVMLCIMPDEFTESFQTYADWKHRSGTYIHVTKFSDIGANAYNPDIIKDHITDAYTNWDDPPTYVLIIGDEGVFPHKIVTYPDYSFPNEDYFVEIEGNDYFPEMMIGRFTNQGDYRMQVMINKYEMYEKTPYTNETDWFKSSTCCSNNEYPSQVSTVRFTANIMMNDGGFEVDTLMSDGYGWGGSGCSMDVYDVINTINDGRSYLNYRGEGWYSGWSANCYQFDVDHVSGLSNGQKFTFVTSIGCGVAGFHSNGGNCFGEEWIQLGSLTSPRGGVAFIGPTSNTHTTYNNRIDKGIYVGMFQEGMDTPGQALLRGKLYMFNVFGNEYWVEYHYKIFCTLGDPSIHIWKEVPLEVNVSHESSINVGNNELEFTATFASNGQPVANAELCLAGNEIFIVDSTDSEGKVYIELSPEEEETLTVTLRGGNVYPYLGSIEVTQLTELIEPQGDPVIVDIDGNTDGLINPNENCNITFTLKNWGTVASNNIEATLSTESTDYVEIVTTNSVDFGNLSPGNSNTGDPFQFFIKPDCPVGQIITLNLHVASTTTSWDYDFTYEVMGCRLYFDNFVVFDEDPQMNFRMDPGEMVRLVFSIGNEGEDDAPDVMGVLSSSDPYITIEDSDGSYGQTNMGDITKNFENYYIVNIDGSCPDDYMAGFSLHLYTENGNYPYQVIHDIELPVGMLVPTDYTGPDSYGYFVYSSDDAFYEQTPVYDWFEIEGIGTEIFVPFVSDYTTTIDLPFDFKYYGVDYDELRISTDGWIAFGSGAQLAPVNTPLPNNDNVNSIAAVFWDDLYDVELISEGDIYYYHDGANHRLIIEWDSISHNDYSTEPHKECFQAILLDPAHYVTATGDGEIIFQYKNAWDIESNTIGIENHSQDIGIQYLYNNEYDQTATNLVDNLAVKFTTEPPFNNIITGDGAKDPIMGVEVKNFGLEQNRPNPFSEKTWINYTIPELSNVTLNVYNINGELVQTLFQGEQVSGRYSVEWNAKDADGNDVNSGIYFYRLQADGFVETMKMFMLR